MRGDHHTSVSGFQALGVKRLGFEGLGCVGLGIKVQGRDSVGIIQGGMEKKMKAI